MSVETSTEHGDSEATSSPPSGRGLLSKLLAIFTRHEKRQLAMLFPAVVLMALLDTAGVASIVPFLGLLSDPEAIDGNRFFAWLYRSLEFQSHSTFFFFVGMCVLSIITFGNVFAAFTTWALLRFSWMRNHTLSTRLLGSYLRRPYAYFLTQNTSTLSQRILSEVQQVVAGVVVQLLLLVARLVVVCFLFVALIVIDPAMALGVASVFGGVYGLILWGARRKLLRLGQDRVAANQARFKLASEMLSGVKEVKLLGLEDTFLARYELPSERFARTWAAAQTLAHLPRYALETVAFGGVVLLVLVLLHRGLPLAEALPALGLYAFAAYRMLPSLQTIFAALTSLRANAAALDILVTDLPPEAEPAPAPPIKPLEFRHAVTLHQVEFAYSGTTDDVIRGVGLELTRGSWFAFVGPTGSGKSTLVDLILGLLEPSRGEIRIDGTLLDSESIPRWQKNLGYVPQQIFLADDTVAANIAFGVPPTEIDRKRLVAAARVAQIHAFVENDLPQGYQTVVGEQGVRLSGGQRQRLGIARALYRRPALLVLDEATSALDSATEDLFFEALRQEFGDCTVISIAHRLTTTRDFDRIFVLDRGTIRDTGTYEDLQLRSDHFASVRDARKT